MIYLVILEFTEELIEKKLPIRLEYLERCGHEE